LSKGGKRGIKLWYFKKLDRVDPKVALKYHCSSEDADSLLIKLREELTEERRAVKVIGLSLREMSNAVMRDAHCECEDFFIRGPRRDCGP